MHTIKIIISSNNNIQFNLKSDNMKKILGKIERIRTRGMATLKLERDSPFFRYNGNTFPVDSFGTPSYKCRITLIIRNKKVHFTINDVL